MSGEFTIKQAPAPADKFRIVSNDFLRGRLPVPLKALERVLLGYFISLPDGWRMNRRQLDESVLEGRNAVTAALRGLETKGYLRRDKSRDRHGTWSWSWSVTADPIEQPLPPAIDRKPVDGPTSGNTTNAQVAPSTGNPSTENGSIEEDGAKKTDQKTDLGTSSGGAPPVKVHAGARTGLRGEQLVGMEPKELTRKLVAVWSAVVKEEGAQLPYLESGYWMGHGDFEGREQHPIGGRVKEWVEMWPNPTVAALDSVLDQIRADARLWAEQHPQRDKEAA